MHYKIRTTYKLAALITLIIISVLIYTKTTETGEIKMETASGLDTILGSAQQPATTDPFSGTLYYDTNTGTMMQYDGMTAPISGGGGGGGGGGGWGAEPITQNFNYPTSGYGPSYSPATPMDYNPNPTYSSFTTAGESAPAQAPAYVDPYAQWGGQAAYDSLIGEIGMGKRNAISSADASRDAAFRGGRSSILDYIDDLKLSQQGIDQKRANAQFSQYEGKGDITEMVGRGIRSGGVMLANKNAGSSGAAGQIARAYGELGNREVKDVNNQFELENQGIDLEQQGLATAGEKQKRKIDEFKIGQSEEIATTARNSLAALEAQRVGASLPEQFQIDQEVQAIKDATMAKLGELDTLLATERGKINPIGRQQVMAKANKMRTAGTGGPQMFNFNTNAPDMSMGGPSLAGAEVPTYSNIALNKRRGV